jgi:hypothetical protein
MFSWLMWIPSRKNYKMRSKTSYGASILLAISFLVGKMAEKWTLLLEAEMISLQYNKDLVGAWLIENARDLEGARPLLYRYIRFPVALNHSSQGGDRLFPRLSGINPHWDSSGAWIGQALNPVKDRPLAWCHPSSSDCFSERSGPWIICPFV